jgi:DNA repair protein RecN (Recombination protein N)
VDIHGQHQHQSLLDTASQRRLVDGYGGLEPLAARVAEGFAAWRALAADLESAQASGAARAAELETLRFQAGEIEALAPAEGEASALRAERDRLANTDRLMAGVSAALASLAEREELAAYAAVVQARRELERLAELDPALRKPVAALAGVEIELRETETMLERYRDRIEADPARLSWLDDRLARMRTLARRHSVDDDELAGVLAR